MKHKLLLIGSVLILMAFKLSAQTTSKVSGQIKDDNGKPIAVATVMLNNAKDSSLAKAAVTNNEGLYQMLLIKPGKYFISTSVVGMQKKSSAVFEVKENIPTTVETITLNTLPKNLQAVTVTAQKPIVEVRADKTIMNVEGTINATGNDALELLRKSPGVMVDKDDNLSLAGKNGVQVYIDGKPSPLTGADLANYLKTMQSSNIESIELITNPSAKYEAAGNAGIINIKLKKNKALGTNGSVNAGYGIGVYSKYNGGFTLNNRNKKTNIFSTYNYNQGLNEMAFYLNRIQSDTIFDQHNRLLIKNKYAHNFKAGVDYYIDAKSTIGFVVNGNISENIISTEGPLNIIYQPTNTLTKILYATGDNDMKRSNVNFNGNYRYALPTGKEFSVDADYAFFNLRNHQYQPNDYYNPITNVKLYSNDYRTISPTDISIYSVKADYEQPYKKGKLAFGGKIGFVNTDNDFRSYNVNNNIDWYDSAKSNRFKYKENINALYANYNRQYKNFMFQVGVRIENTNSDGRSTGFKLDTISNTYKNYDSANKRNYVDAFPSAAITFNKNPMNQFSITYSRRIDRPAYQDLNPFEFKVNDYTYMKGNTDLKPQYTNSFGITNTYKYRLTTQLNYSHVKDIFTQIPDTIGGSKSFLSKKNLNSQDIVSLNISYPFQYKWYGFFANVNSFYSQYKANYGGGDRVVNVKVAALTFYMQNSFKLSKTLTAELTGLYLSPSVWQGTFKTKSMSSIDAGLQKTILKGKGNFKIAVSDIFQTMHWNGKVNFSGQTSTASGHGESRQLKLNFNYRFGSATVKAARQRQAAIDDENKRTQSSGGLGGN